MGKDYYTTHEISDLLKVDFTTVIDWCDKGKIQCYKTPGGHRRVLPRDLFAFMRKFGFAIPEELRKEAPLKMLVVDDEESIRGTVSRMLKLTWPDAEVDTAKDGFEAGKKLALMRPDVIVLDVNLPGQDGFAVCQLIRNDPATGHARVLAISGELDPLTRNKMLAAGANDFLPKPFDLADLAARVQTLLRTPQTDSKAAGK